MFMRSPFLRSKYLCLFFTIVCSQILSSAAHSLPLYSENGKKSYKNYKVLRTDAIEDSNAVSTLLMLDGISDVEFWKYPLLNQSADILTSPARLNYVEDVLNKVGLRHTVLINDAEDLVQKELLDDYLDKKNSAMNWNSYQRYDVISDWIQSNVKREPTVSNKVIGHSTEGREIHMVKLSTGDSNNKSAIFIDGGMHAREWISPATVTYIMNELITNSKHQELLDKFDWYFVPIINVDGYEYSHTKDRFWRKTRSVNPEKPLCFGVDPNRNFDFKWKFAGSSNDPCSQTYHGPRPFSEPETKALSNAILGLRKQIKLYLTLHSYSQVWLVPWSHSKSTKPADYQDLLALAKKGKYALQRTHGTQYRIGTAPDLLYAAAGGSDDWAKASGIKYSYTLELRDTGKFGFALPPSQIKATGEETFNGVSAVALALHETLNKETN